MGPSLSGWSARWQDTDKLLAVFVIEAFWLSRFELVNKSLFSSNSILIMSFGSVSHFDMYLLHQASILFHNLSTSFLIYWPAYFLNESHFITVIDESENIAEYIPWTSYNNFGISGMVGFSNLGFWMFFHGKKMNDDAIHPNIWWSSK